MVKEHMLEHCIGGGIQYSTSHVKLNFQVTTDLIDDFKVDCIVTNLWQSCLIFICTTDSRALLIYRHNLCFW